VSNGTGETLLSIGGRNHRIMREELDTDLPGGTHGGGGDGRIEAPMPGNIVSVAVAEGDTVEAGDPVIVLESMKMQNEITAPIDGVVRKLGCSAGQQVSFGEILAVIEPPE
jgi:biotin carboxyl carrier protein